MNKFKFYFILLITTVFIFSCSKDDDGFTPVPLRDYTVQYKTDSTAIDDYLRGYYIEEIKENPGQPNDQDITMTKIPEGGTQASIMSYLNAEGFPTLKSKIVSQDGVDYTLYYLVLRKGTGESPCNVDGVFTAYKGDYIFRTVETETTPSTITTTFFQEAVYPETIFNLFTLETIPLQGWSEVLPEFKKGTRTTNEADGKISYNDFGAGVMFLPSGLGYYNAAQAGIPAYSPLIFSFKLYDIQRLDHDLDGIPSYLEDLNNDGYMRILASGTDNPDDTDKDGLPDFYDKDDDGDNYTTALEIKNPATGLAYPFDLIPTCTTGTETKKNYLVKTCYPLK